MRRWHVYRLPDITAHLLMLLAKVGVLKWVTSFSVDLDLIVVNIWDVVGEEQIVKGEYKVISGRVYVIFSLLRLFTFGWACSDCLISFLLFF